MTEVSSLPVRNGQGYALVCSTYDKAVCADVREFYRFRESSISRVTFVASFNMNWGLRATVITGAKAAKLTIQPKAIFGLIGSIPTSNGGGLSGEIYGSVGGSLIHRPCMDSYDREYFCGNLTAWSDFTSRRVPHRESGVKVLWRY